MIDAYLANTANGHKLGIMLEELGQPYRLHHLDLGKRQQKEPAFLAINPNGRIPAIVDSEGPDGRPFNVFESGAILLYLAEKYGKFLPSDPRRRSEAVQWLMFQMGGVGPMMGQAAWFLHHPERPAVGVERYVSESRRLVSVLESRLSQEPYLAGEEYSVADVATWPWIAQAVKHLGVNLDETPGLKRWYEAVGARPAVQRGLAICQRP